MSSEHPLPCRPHFEFRLEAFRRRFVRPRHGYSHARVRWRHHLQREGPAGSESFALAALVFTTWHHVDLHGAAAATLAVLAAATTGFVDFHSASSRLVGAGILPVPDNKVIYDARPGAVLGPEAQRRVLDRAQRELKGLVPHVAADRPRPPFLQVRRPEREPVNDVRLGLLASR